MKILATLTVLWLPFSIMVLIAIPVSFFAVLAWSQVYGKNLLGGMDRTGSGLLGLDARYTISAHCGAMTKPYLLPIRLLLERIQPGHCLGAAKNEGLV